ncbi:MAG: class I SAM-dependent methyltransferase [Pseudonocardiaceae bacterium]
MNMRDLVVGRTSSLGGRARARRWQYLYSTFPQLGSYRVLDLGGTPGSWLQAPVQPRSLTVLNLYDGELQIGYETSSLPSWITVVAGDACDPPQHVREQQFDLVFSNSLIEHVGGSFRRKMLASFICGTSSRYWIQTPYRYFPIEPHWIFPAFQFLPLATRSWLSRTWPLMHSRAEDWTSSVVTALDVELLSITEMNYLFPEATIYRERMFGLVKSIIAIRS